MSEQSRIRDSERKNVDGRRSPTLMKKALFGIGLIAVGSGATYTWNSTSLYDGFRPVTLEVARRTPERRTDYLQKIAKGFNLDHIERVEYDGDGTKKKSYLEMMTKKYVPANEKIGMIALPEVREDNNGKYTFAILNSHLSIGNGQKSPVFFGRTLFEDSNPAQFGEIVFQDSFLQINRFAQRHHSGYENIDSKLLSDKILRGEVNALVLYSLAEVDAGMYCLHKSPLSRQLPEEMRRQHGVNVALNLEILKKEYFKPGVTPFVQHLIRTALYGSGIGIDTNRIPVPKQIPSPKNPKNKSF